MGFNILETLLGYGELPEHVQHKHREQLVSATLRNTNSWLAHRNKDCKERTKTDKRAFRGIKGIWPSLLF